MKKTVIQVRVEDSLKKTLEKQLKKSGMSTLSEYIRHIIREHLSR